jgi:hypothetical protein
MRAAASGAGATSDDDVDALVRVVGTAEEHAIPG